jgi:predicted nuclease of predicted toxin-antitoxin system
MKLLFDQNISYRIIEIIIEYFPEAKHIKQLGLENNTDK